MLRQIPHFGATVDFKPEHIRRDPAKADALEQKVESFLQNDILQNDAFRRLVREIPDEQCTVTVERYNNNSFALWVVHPDDRQTDFRSRPRAVGQGFGLKQLQNPQWLEDFLEMLRDYGERMKEDNGVSLLEMWNS